MHRAIFLSYRRDDSEGEAGRLYDDLVRAFGNDSVFMDVAGIEPGVDFRKAIDGNVASCGVLLAIIGPNWTRASHADGTRRLDEPNDFVRLEIGAALTRDIPVVPVLVHEARMPRAEELPEALRELAYRNCVELTHARWNSDVALLITALGRYVQPSAAQPAGKAVARKPEKPALPASAPAQPAGKPWLRWAMVGAGALVVVLVLLAMLGRNAGTGQNPPIQGAMQQAASAPPQTAQAANAPPATSANAPPPGAMAAAPLHASKSKAAAPHQAEPEPVLVSNAANGPMRMPTKLAPNENAAAAPNGAALGATGENALMGSWGSGQRKVGLERLVLTRGPAGALMVRAQSACQPAPCDWGQVRATFDGTAATAHWHLPANSTEPEREATVMMQRDGDRLDVQVYTQLPDRRIHGKWSFARTPAGS